MLFYLKNLVSLFYPKLCVTCENQLLTYEDLLCTFCRHDLPITNFENTHNNKVCKIFYGRIEIDKAFSLLYYRKENITQKLIHNLKYKNNEEIGVFFGNWIGSLCKNKQLFEAIDYIVPVPIDKNKLKERGYNQLTKFGNSLSFHLNKAIVKDQLLKSKTSISQSSKNRYDRFKDLENKFFIKDISFFRDKHVLLIDDVVTTGATLEACAKQLLYAEGCKISILTMAYTA